MTVYQQTINSATPWVDFQTWFHNCVTAEGWVLVEPLFSAPALVTGTSTGCATSSATATTITRSGGTNWGTGAMNGTYFVYIRSGTGAGTYTPIVSNTTNVITVASWSVQPDNTSVFDIAYMGYVYKSPGTLNSVGQDFYIGLKFHQTLLGFTLFEQWDAVNKKALKYAPSSGTGITVNPADNTVTNAVGVVLADSAMFFAGAAYTASVAHTHYMDITVNRLCYGRTANPSGAYVWHVGVCQSLLPSSMDPVPLAIVRGDMLGSSTREPGTPAPGPYNFLLMFTTSYSKYGVMGNNSPTSDIYRGNSHTVYRIYCNSSRPNNSNSTPRAVLDVITCSLGATVDDTLTVTMDDGATRTYKLTSIMSSALNWYTRMT